MMDEKAIKTAADKIHMSAQMKRRIIRNCTIELSDQREEHTMKHQKNIRKPIAMLAALAVCLTLSLTALAAIGAMQGYFRDIKNFSGAITGTAYEQATDEITVTATVSGSDLTVLADFVNPQMFPYREAEKLGIAAYRIVDANSNTVKEGSAESVTVAAGQAAISIPLDSVESGSYKLVISAFVAEKRAEQPLNISGYWECSFTK